VTVTAPRLWRVSTALEVTDLVKTYRSRAGEIRAADGVTFAAASGAITAVLGPNGAGKTTTLECCAGLRSPDSGTLTVLGRDRSRASAADDAWLREHVGVMVQAGGLPQAPPARAVLQHVAKLYPDPVDLGSLTRELTLDKVLDTPVRQLSGGERQRVAVACALLGRPSLAFLDEPSSGVDPHARRATWDLLRRERERGCAVVLTTHHLDEAEELADHVVIIDAGRVVAAGTVPELASGYTLTVDGVADPSRVLGALPRGATDGSAEPAAPHQGRVTVVVQRDDAAFLAGIVTNLVAAGEGGAHVAISRRTLESVFLERTGRDAITAGVD